MIGMIKKLTGCALVLSILVFGATAYALAQKRGSVQRVQFPRGRTTVVLKGTIKGKSDATYVLRASAGQTLIAHLAVAEGDYASLQTRGPDHLVLTNADGTDAGEDFSIPLTQTGDYRITVFPPDTADKTDVARYTLEIAVR
jgi:hypothetical protein